MHVDLLPPEQPPGFGVTRVSSTVALIAVVDDDASMRRAITGLVRSAGFTAEAFSRAQDFLDSEQVGHVDCLISDVNMPGMSGLDLHHNLARSGHNIPTILVTAYPNEAIRSRALTAGVLCYLAKPFADNDLLACINLALPGPLRLG